MLRSTGLSIVSTLDDTLSSVNFAYLTSLEYTSSRSPGISVMYNKEESTHKVLYPLSVLEGGVTAKYWYSGCVLLFHFLLVLGGVTP